MNVFVGSSGQASAAGDVKIVCKLLEDAGLTPFAWIDSDAFTTGRNLWEALCERLHETDAAAFIFSEDDHLVAGVPQATTPKKELIRVPRDNVVLEYGLFCGAMCERQRIRHRLGLSASADGREFCAHFVRGDPKLPSDLGGVVPIYLDGDQDRAGAIASWVRRMNKQKLLPTAPTRDQADKVIQVLLQDGATQKTVTRLMHLWGVAEEHVQNVFLACQTYLR